MSVTTGMALASLGTDSGGSIRIPAAACGIVGLKPACGEVPTEGVVPLSRSLDHLGPLARCVRDVRLLYPCLIGSPGRPGLAEDYLRALKGREGLRERLDAALGDHDALVLPTLPVPAQPIGTERVVVDGVEHLLRPLTLKLTQPFNITGHPAISLPCGVTAEGLPCGLQLVGRSRQTEALLGVALTCEDSLGRLTPTGVGS